MKLEIPRKTIIVVVLLLAIGQASSWKPLQAGGDATSLTGVWNCDDGGKYYLRQLGNTVWWYGERDPNDPSWSNVAKGNISVDSIQLEWADVPKGDYLLNGTLTLQIISNNELQATEKTGIFGGSRWTR